MLDVSHRMNFRAVLFAQVSLPALWPGQGAGLYLCSPMCAVGMDALRATVQHGSTTEPTPPSRTAEGDEEPGWWPGPLQRWSCQSRHRAHLGSERFLSWCLNLLWSVSVLPLLPSPAIGEGPNESNWGSSKSRGGLESRLCWCLAALAALLLCSQELRLCLLNSTRHESLRGVTLRKH